MTLYDILDDLNHIDKPIRQAAYVQLISGGRQVVPDLLYQFPHIEGGARLSVIRALGEIGDPRAVPLLVDLMTEREPHSYFMTPSLAAKALGQIGGEAAIKGLLDHLQNGEPIVRRMAVVVLSNMDSANAVRALSKALDDDDDQVRTLAADALRKQGSPQALALLDSAGYRH